MAIVRHESLWARMMGGEKAVLARKEAVSGRGGAIVIDFLEELEE